MRTGWSWHRSWGECGCSGRCGCRGKDRIALGYIPITAVVSVWENGVELDPSEYHLDPRGRWVERDEGSWPATQDVWADRSEPDTLEFEIEWGAEPPAAGLAVARYYANQIAIGLCGDGECDLPSRVQSITRQGVSYTFASITELIAGGRTGVGLVDTWLANINGGPHPNYPAVIASPDAPCGEVIVTAHGSTAS